MLRRTRARIRALPGASPRIANATPVFELGAFDLDGTVLRRDLGISARTVAALDELRGRGLRLVVATGRRFEGAREHAERLGFADVFFSRGYDGNEC